jgi:tetratricopeptide (TPR) repeat protein
LSHLGEDAGEVALANIATFAGDHVAAARYLQRLCDLLQERGNNASLSASAPALGRALCALGRHDEAEEWARIGRELERGRQSGLWGGGLWRQVQALVHASRGEHGEAESLAREAAALFKETDMLVNQGNAYCDLAEVLATAGRTEGAAEALEQALERYERKKNLAMVAQVQPKLEGLRKKAEA